MPYQDKKRPGHRDAFFNYFYPFVKRRKANDEPGIVAELY